MQGRGQGLAGAHVDVQSTVGVIGSVGTQAVAARRDLGDVKCPVGAGAKQCAQIPVVLGNQNDVPRRERRAHALGQLGKKMLGPEIDDGVIALQHL